MNKTLKALYARKQDEPDYMEELITENEDRFEDAKEWAKGQGYSIFRIAVIDMTVAPDFAATVK